MKGRFDRFMWLFTLVGFFSVTASKQDPKVLQVRARVRTDLDALRSKYLPKLTDTIEIPGRDYPYRGFCSHKEFAEAAVQIVMDVTYSNFKSAVSRTEGQGWEREQLYHQVWDVMYKAEDKLAKKREANRSWQNKTRAPDPKLQDRPPVGYEKYPSVWDDDDAAPVVPAAPQRIRTMPLEGQSEKINSEPGKTGKGGSKPPRKSGR